MVVTPLLVGERIGLNPLAVIFALLACGQLFGFVGVLLALPAAAAPSHPPKMKNAPPRPPPAGAFFFVLAGVFPPVSAS